MDDKKWQHILLSLDLLAEAAGVTLSPFPKPPGKGPVGQEWANPWQREAWYLDWLTSNLDEINRAMDKKAASERSQS